MRALVFEEHSSVLAQWWRERAHPRTVVYLDAHLDLQYVNDDRLRRLEQCTTAEDVEALAKPHPLWPDRGFSYGLENFLYPAARLGLIDRLIWVAPPHVHTGYSPANLERLCQTDGVRWDDLQLFRKEPDGRIEGRMLGLDVTICDASQLEQLPLPPDALIDIDIDIDYFVCVPGDHTWTDPTTVFQMLERLPPRPRLITISRSVETGFTPLRHRFIADHLAALWEGSTTDSAHYDRLFQLDRRIQAGEREAVLVACRQERDSHPDCAATWYLLSLAEPEGALAAKCRAQATALSAAYRPSLLRSACGIRSRRLPASLADVMALQRQLREFPLDSEGQALAEAELGMTYTVLGQLGHALDCYRRATGPWEWHPELALEIAQLLVRAGRTETAIPFLHQALEDDKTKTAAHMLLAHIDAARGLLEESRRHLEQALERAPAWGLLLEMLALVHQQLGNADEARRLHATLDEHRRECNRLARRFG